MKVDENEFFRQTTLCICSSLDIDRAFRRCFDCLNQFIPISGLFFSLYEPDLNAGRFVASIWPSNLKSPPDTITMPTELKDWIRGTWTGAPRTRIINDFAKTDPPTRQISSMFWPEDSSHIHMDLELDKERFGSLHLFTEGKNRYTDAHARLLSLLHEPFAVAISNILQHQEVVTLENLLADDYRYLHRRLLEITGDTIIGADHGLARVMEMVRQVAPLNSPVLLMGETGVGKEVIANAIHNESLRKNCPCIKVNCAAIPESRIDSELFGHEKGAFAGAVSSKRGRFERAHTGTIFLDEIGELPQLAQVRLLRVLQHGEFERVGGTEPIRVDVRIISATHRNLQKMVRRGQFREDLWFRLNVFPIMIPPLRQRTEDIPALVNHFIAKKANELNIRELPGLAGGSLERLQEYHWPGNVRELENLVERALIQRQTSGGGGQLHFYQLLADPIAESAANAAGQRGPILPLDVVAANHIQLALKSVDGRVEGRNGAARLLGLHPSTLRGRMRKLGIVYGRKA